MGLIALLTDFGWNDGYVAMMKGVIHGIAPGGQWVDLGHDLPPQNLWAANFLLAQAVPYFPPDTIFLAVVDPGVGTTRRAIALHTSQGYFVGPDNGIFTRIYQETQVFGVVTLDRPRWWRSPTPTHTFHGRDIFAPVAAHLQRGVAFSALGSPVSVSELVTLPQPLPQVQGSTVRGVVQYIDHFGNVITNLSPVDLGPHWQVLQVEKTLRSPLNPSQTYGDRDWGELVALVGSHGWLEIAVNGGRGCDRLGCTDGSVVVVRVHRSPRPESEES